MTSYEVSLSWTHKSVHFKPFQEPAVFVSEVFNFVQSETDGFFPLKMFRDYQVWRYAVWSFTTTGVSITMRGMNVATHEVRWLCSCATLFCSVMRIPWVYFEMDFVCLFSFPEHIFHFLPLPTTPAPLFPQNIIVDISQLASKATSPPPLGAPSHCLPVFLFQKRKLLWFVGRS
jgi:hypothetical protein